MPLAAPAVECIRAELGAAAHGERRAVVRRLADAFGVSPSSIYRAARVHGAARARDVARPEYRRWVPIAVALVHQAPKPIPLDVALRAGIERGLLPAEAARMPIATAYRVAREMGLVVRPRLHRRLHADYPMQAVLMDWSSSEHLVAERPVGDDWLLKLHRRPWSAGGYKNKPLKPHRMRVGVYALWEMCTGYVTARYAVERGESALGAMEFLCWALAEAEASDPRHVLHGVPDDLWMDGGPFAKSAPMRDLVGRMGIATPPAPPYQKTRMGGVERSHRTRWSRFERALFLRARQTILLSELNARMVEFTVTENARRVSRTEVPGRPGVSRTAAWVALTRARETPLRRLPERPMETLAHERRCWIDAAGVIRWGGVEYEAAGGWHDRWVVARRALDGSGDLALEDEATEAKQVARRYAPRPYGAIRTGPKTPLDRLLEAGGPDVDADVWAPASAANVARLPARVAAPAAPLANPLDTDRLSGPAEAMRVFSEVYPWPLSAANRALVVQRIEVSGCSRRAVVALAQSLTTITEAGGGTK